MSRELRIARTTALQFAAQHHLLRQQELGELTQRAQMGALKAQINPHFLFNTLNVLSNLIHTDAGKAERVTEELADIFRYALDSTRLEWVKLEDELGFLGSYLGIEKARFDERLEFSIDVDSSIRSAKIPPMILQPLVENAIKHGIGPKVEGGAVWIRGSAAANRLVLIVEDSGAGLNGSGRHSGAGIGLKNIRERLEHIFGSSAEFKLEHRKPEGTRAVLTLPSDCRGGL
jgi:LytS/YehU family sensor histidine kinase